MQKQNPKIQNHQHDEYCECEHNQQEISKQFNQKVSLEEENFPEKLENQPNQEANEQNQENQAEQEGPEYEDGEIDSEQQDNGKWKKIEQPEKTVKLFMIDFAHCDAKKCSDKKKKFKGVVLSAFGKKQCSFEDLQYAQKYGVCVVDCSWNRIQETREFRKLPFVTAGNPVNYGKPYQLSCAEALATALCTIGYNDQAEYIMSKFGWSDGFWSLNPLIENYSKCKTLEDLKKESKAIEEKGTEKFQRNYDLSDPESSGDQN